jgi:hypothetical protein
MRLRGLILAGSHLLVAGLDRIHRLERMTRIPGRLGYCPRAAGRREKLSFGDGVGEDLSGGVYRRVVDLPLLAGQLVSVLAHSAKTDDARGYDGG